MICIRVTQFALYLLKSDINEIRKKERLPMFPLTNFVAEMTSTPTTTPTEPVPIIPETPIKITKTTVTSGMIITENMLKFYNIKTIDN